MLNEQINFNKKLFDIEQVNNLHVARLNGKVMYSAESLPKLLKLIAIKERETCMPKNKLISINGVDVTGWEKVISRENQRTDTFKHPKKEEFETVLKPGLTTPNDYGERVTHFNLLGISQKTKRIKVYSRY